MKKAIWFGFILGFLSLGNFAFFSDTQAQTSIHQGAARTEFDESVDEEVVILPTDILLPEFSAEIQEFEGPEFHVENGTEGRFTLRGFIKPGIYYDFGLNVKIGYNQSSAKKGLAYEEDLLIQPRPNGKFEIEVPFIPVLELSRVFVVAEIYYQDQLLTRQLFKTDKLPKRPEEKPEVAEPVEQKEDVTEKPKPSVAEPETPSEVQEPKEEVIEVLEVQEPSLFEKFFQPKTGNPFIDHWPIFGAIGLIVLLILIGSIRKGLKKRHLHILFLVIGVSSYFFLVHAREEANSGGTWTLPQIYGTTFYSLDESHPLSNLPIQFQGTYTYEEPSGSGTFYTDVFDESTVERIGIRIYKEDQSFNNTNFEFVFRNPVEISPNVYQYEEDGETLDVTFGPNPGEFSFDFPLAIFTRGTYATKSFDDGVWAFELKVRFDRTAASSDKWVYIPYELADGTTQYIGIDSLPPTFGFTYKHDAVTGDDSYPTTVTDVTNPDPLIPVPTKHPIKLEIGCTDDTTFDPARNGNALPPYSDFEPSGCTEDDGSSSGADPVVREIFVRGNFCDDPDKCDTIGYRTFRTCDGSANCGDSEVFIDWYDPIPPKLNKPFGLEPGNPRVTYDNENFLGLPNNELPTGIRFVREHPTDPTLSIKMSGLESPRASIAAGDDMTFEFFLDDEDYHIDSDGLCYGIGCPVGFDPVADASSDNFYDEDACGYEVDGTRLDNLYLNATEGICDEIHRSCINDQGFVGMLNESVSDEGPDGRVCLMSHSSNSNLCPPGYTPSADKTQCEP